MGMTDDFTQKYVMVLSLQVDHNLQTVFHQGRFLKGVMTVVMDFTTLKLESLMIIKTNFLGMQMMMSMIG